jgi:hypothetical protein
LDILRRGGGHGVAGDGGGEDPHQG